MIFSDLVLLFKILLGSSDYTPEVLILYSVHCKIVEELYEGGPQDQDVANNLEESSAKKRIFATLEPKW